MIKSFLLLGLALVVSGSSGALSASTVAKRPEPTAPTLDHVTWSELNGEGNLRVTGSTKQADRAVKDIPQYGETFKETMYRLWGQFKRSRRVSRIREVFTRPKFMKKLGGWMSASKTKIINVLGWVKTKREGLFNRKPSLVPR